MRSFTFNTDSTDSRAALVRDYQNLIPVARTAFTVGEVALVNLCLANSSGYDPLNGIATVVASIGQPGGLPTIGNYSLAWNGSTSGLIAFNAASADVQTALNQIAALNGNVAVTGQFPVYQITFVGSLASGPQALFTLNSSLLNLGGVVSIASLQTGASGVSAVQGIILQMNPPVYQATWTPATGSNPGWTGTLDFSQPALQALFTVGQPYLAQVLEFSFSSAGNVSKYSLPVEIYAQVKPTITNSFTTIAPMSGVFAIPNAAAGGVVTGLNLSNVPRVVTATVVGPDGALALFPTIIAGSITTDGFSFNLNGITDSANYKLHYTLNF